MSKYGLVYADGIINKANRAEMATAFETMSRELVHVEKQITALRSELAKAHENARHTMNENFRLQGYCERVRETENRILPSSMGTKESIDPRQWPMRQG